MVDIVLLQLPIWGVGCPSLGLALLKSYLADNGIKAKVLDINAHLYSIRGGEYADYWDIAHGYDYCASRDKMFDFYRDHRALFLYYIDQIRRMNPKIVGCACFTASFELTKIFLQDLRAFYPHFKHIVGGPEVAWFMRNTDELIAKDYIDAICHDEGEISFVEYFQAVQADDGRAVPGVVYKREGDVITAGPREFIKKLDELPFPDFSDFNLRNYVNPRVLPSYATRGCINNCIYCSARNYMKPYRFRSGKRMFEEVKYLKSRYPELNYIRMADNISNGNIKELETFCDLMIEADLGVKWNLENAVIRKEMRTPLYKKLKHAGCTLLGYGMETPCTGLLRKVGKVLSKDVDMARVLSEGKKAGLCISVNIMFGLPGETDEDFNELLLWLKKNKNAFDVINPSIIFCEFYPGCAVFEDPDKYGIDMSKGTLFWETKDGKNTYPVRMERFERFCRQAKKYGLSNLFYIEELPNKNEMLFKYHFVSKEYDRALEYYQAIPAEKRTPEINRMHQQITRTGSAEPQMSEVETANFLPYHDSFEKTFAASALTDNLRDLEQVPLFRIPGSGWKRWIRARVYLLLERLIGFDAAQKKINNCYSMMKVMDAKLQCLLEMNKDKPADDSIHTAIREKNLV